MSVSEAIASFEMVGLCTEGYTTNMKMTVSTAQASTVKYTLLNNNGGTNSKILFGLPTPGSSQINFEVYFGNNLGFNYYLKNIGYGVNTSGSTPPTPPTPPTSAEVTMKVTDISPSALTQNTNGIEIPQNTEKTITQAVPRGTLLQIEYSLPAGTTKSYNCTEPKSDLYPDGRTKTITPTTKDFDRTFKITPSDTTTYQVSCTEVPTSIVIPDDSIDTSTRTLPLGSSCPASTNKINEPLNVHISYGELTYLQRDDGTNNGVIHYNYDVWVTSSSSISSGATVNITGSYLQRPLVDDPNGKIRFNYCGILTIPASSDTSNKIRFIATERPSASVSSSVYLPHNTNNPPALDPIDTGSNTEQTIN